jgi:hypothetical protein
MLSTLLLVNAKKHVSSMYHTLVCDFPNFHSMHEKGIFAC